MGTEFDALKPHTSRANADSVYRCHSEMPVDIMNRLAIVSTHPIQYNAPLFRLLAGDEVIDLKVFFSKKTEEIRFDKDFGREVVWDIPLY